LSDMVNHPPHYNQGGIECIDAIEASFSPKETSAESYLKGTTLKYLWRFKEKEDPVQDLLKAKWFLDRLIKTVESKKLPID